MSFEFTLMLVIVLMTVSSGVKAADVPAVTQQDCTRATSDIERYDLGCPVSLAVQSDATAERPTE